MSLREFETQRLRLLLLINEYSVLSANIARIKDGANASMLTVSMLLMLLFVTWMFYQERRGRPALIPNYLWRNAAFSSVCAMIALCMAMQNSMDSYSSLL